MSIPTVEWLEADGLGGFASGTSRFVRTRRYHGLLLSALTPPTGRVMLVNGAEAWLETPTATIPISTQHYAPDVLHPDGAERIISFSNDPWPKWTIRVDDSLELEYELFAAHGEPLTAMAWRLRGGDQHVRLCVRPLLSGRDYHATHHENAAFRFDADVAGERVTWRPYEGVPAIIAIANGAYEHRPEWYRNFLYREELSRGLDATEDLASPGVFSWDLSRPAILMLTTQNTGGEPAERLMDQLRTREARRRVFSSPLHRAADAYLVRRGGGRTIVAGYPWFTDWGRDTFIAVRGLCIATGRLEDARDILLAWSDAVSEGMLPNRFPDRGDTPEFNAVDASLWYVIAVGDLFEASRDRSSILSDEARLRLQRAVDAILEGYAAGTRFRIRLDGDGLLACGEPGAQVTWMDSKIGDWVVTPRIGKPVEVQALWLNALAVSRQWTNRWAATFEAGRAAFRPRFWNEAAGCLFDVVDVDHQAGRTDDTIRPNQILAVGGLPLVLLEPADARRVVQLVEDQLLTPMGLRSLAPRSPAYAGRYEGTPSQRDARYHQGTVWPWLLGPFVDAWRRVHGSSPRTRRVAVERFLQPLLQLAEQSGGHLPEIADGDPPHTPRGCPAQAWSVAEILRVQARTVQRRAPRRLAAVV